MAESNVLHGNPLGLLTVLLTRLSAMGDVAMTIPVVYSACVTYPDIRFVMVTRVSMTGMFVNPPQNLTVVGIDLKEDYRGLRGIYRLSREILKDYRPDAYADLHNVLRTRLLGGLLRLHGVVVAHIGKGRGSKRALTRRHRKVMLPLVSQRARYREVFARLGLPVTESFRGLYPAAGADNGLYSRITPAKAEGERWLGIAPFAAHDGKIYPLAEMERVLETVVTRHPGVRVFLFGGGASEAAVLDAWAEKYPRTTSLAGKKYGFPAELALQSHLDVLLTMDSANMHLGALAGCPVVSVWGATHPYCGFRPWHQDSENCVQLPLSCRPCSVYGNRRCYRGDHLCMTALRPETLYNKIAPYL